MMKFSKYLLYIIVIFPLTLFAGESQSLKLVNTYDQGKLYQKNKIPIAVLQGNYYEMGKQYGVLLRSQIRAFHRDYIVNTIGKNPALLKKIKLQFADQTWSGYSARQQQLIQGIAKGAGLTRDDILLIDNALLFGGLMPRLNLCSFLAVWGPYTENHELLAARNLDWMPSFEKYSSLISVIVYKPDDGSHAVATIVYPGMIGALTGINDQGLFLSVNDGADSLGNVYVANRMSFLNKMFDFLLDSSNMDGLQKAINTTRANFPVILDVAGKEMASIYEDAPFAIEHREAKPNGVIAATNDYLLKRWGIMRLGTFTKSMTRYDHLLKLANQYKGKINVITMQKIMSLPLVTKEGKFGPGVTEYATAKNETIMTMYQVISAPKSNIIWVRIPNYSDWTEIDLNPLFR